MSWSSAAFALRTLSQQTMRSDRVERERDELDEIEEMRLSSLL